MKRHFHREAHAMQTDTKKQSKAKASSTAKLTSQVIAEQTVDFLKAGGKIIKVRSGAREEVYAEKGDGQA